MFSLRDYQRMALDHVQQRLQQGERRLYISLPTGTGKSVLMAALALQASKQGRVLVLVHLQELVVQLANTLTNAGLDVGLLMQGHRHLDRPVVVATPPSLLTTLPAFLQASEAPTLTVFIDEAHHAVEGSVYASILQALEAHYGPAQVTAIGFTATPYRRDSRSMLALLPTCAFIREIPQMIKAGWLAPLTWIPLPLTIDLATLPTMLRDGEQDYAERALTRTLLQTALMEEIVRRVVPHLQTRPTLVFAVSVDHAERLAALFREAGRTAAAVSGQMSLAQREQVYAAWRAGNTQVVCNCALLTEGFDFPELAALVIARPTRSASFYMQMLGRGMRRAPGKEDCLVIDVMGNRPDLTHQMLLPHLMGVTKLEEMQALTGGQATPPDPIADALLEHILEAEVEAGLALLDPVGHSPYRWSAYQGRYFTMLNSDVAAIVEPDRSGSGLYHSRLYTMPRGKPPTSTWIERRDLPLRQQVALVHEATATRYPMAWSSKDAPWLDDPASAMQVAALQKLHHALAERAQEEHWTKRMATEAISFWLLRKTLWNPPSPRDPD